MHERVHARLRLPPELLMHKPTLLSVHSEQLSNLAEHLFNYVRHSQWNKRP